MGDSTEGYPANVHQVRQRPDAFDGLRVLSRQALAQVQWVGERLGWWERQREMAEFWRTQHQTRAVRQ
jgi:hypothetical protein